MCSTARMASCAPTYLGSQASFCKAAAALLNNNPKGSLQSRAGDGAAIVLHAVRQAVSSHGGKKPLRGTMGAPELTQLSQGLVGQGHITVF